MSRDQYVHEKAGDDMQRSVTALTPRHAGAAGAAGGRGGTGASPLTQR